MKRTILILFSSIICVFGVHSQRYVMEQRISPLEYLTFSIDLYDNNTYILSCTKHRINSDILDLNLLSFGYFEKTDDVYTLIDKFNNYQLSIKEIIMRNGSVNKILKTIDGFKWMKSSFFILSENKPSDIYFLIENLSAPTKEKSVKPNHQQDKEFNFHTGKYESNSINYKIVLDPDQSYSIYLYDYLLSSGKWKKRKNVLTLTDISIKTDRHIN